MGPWRFCAWPLYYVDKHPSQVLLRGPQVNSLCLIFRRALWIRGVIKGVKHMTAKRYSLHVTHADCVFTFTKGGGPGGPNVNKRNTKCRCVHLPSGSVGLSFDERSQDQNKKTAFMRMARTEAFRRWAYLEATRLSGRLAEVEESVRRALLPHNLRLEVKGADGRWNAVPFSTGLSDDVVAEAPRVAVSVDGTRPEISSGRKRR